jgi:DNA-directed RNA polymerase specialized sigma24 family protein
MRPSEWSKQVEDQATDGGVMRTAGTTQRPEAGSDGELPDFEAFVRATEPRLARAFAAAYGFEDGRDATAEALAYAFEHWDRLQQVGNLAGYLFRVGQSRSRRRRQPVLFAVPDGAEHAFEPGLPAALAGLTERQRLAVVLA